MIFYPAEATAWLTWLCCPEARQDGLQTAARGSLLAPETQHRPCWVQTQIGNCSRAREGGKLGIFSLAAASPFQTGTENRGPLLFGGSGASALPLPPKVHRTRARPQPRDRFARKTPDRVQTQPAHSGTCPFTDPFPPRSGKTSPAAGKGPGTRAQWATGKPQAPLGRFYIKYRIGARGQVMEGEPYYHFKHRGTRQKALSRHWGWNMRLTKEPKVLWFEQQTVKKRTKRSVSVVPTDPWFHKQWYMNNDIDPDLNILTAWSKGYTGLGVVLTVLDDGIEKDHPDLSANYDPLASYDFNSNDPDPQPRYTTRDENRHGTRCAGEVAAAANNRICGAGVAYNARVGGVRMLDGPITDVVEAQSLSLRPQHIHIYSASWGPEDDGKTVDGPGVLAAEAFYRGVTKGRGGLGSIFIWASGNGGLNYDNCNCDGYANSIYTLSVGSVLAGGQRPWYGEGCSAILTTTYSSRTTSEVQIVTTDLHHRCTDKHTGTSASAPLAAGMIALALEANPALTWRDLQHLVIRTSKPAHLQAEDWAVNGVGRKVSHHYGYGLLDAGLLVEMAKAWPGTRPQRRCSVKALHAPRNIGSKLTVSTDISSCSGRTKRIRSLEHVQVQLSLSYSRRGDLVIALTSPMGTTSTLVTVRPYDTSQQGYKDWTFMSTHFWDENPNGTWTLRLENKGDAYNTEPSFSAGPRLFVLRASTQPGRGGNGLLSSLWPQSFQPHIHQLADPKPWRMGTQLPSAPSPVPPAPRSAGQLHPAPPRHRRGRDGQALCSLCRGRVRQAGCAGSVRGAPACPTALRATTPVPREPPPRTRPASVPAATPPATRARALRPTTARPVPPPAPSMSSPAPAPLCRASPPRRGCRGTFSLSSSAGV
ncbi:proprotein convertase subtilisin/kexin type 4 isoform X5 [Mycteria americana]|uniref:proprotein convertase subtilisin/kexin type 4 isoform X5 n=1 Tax=Mycteria americana TaxID=33587 RepID=UPI003F584EA6